MRIACEAIGHANCTVPVLSMDVLHTVPWGLLFAAGWLSTAANR